MTCEKDIIDIGKCIYKAPLVKELINDVIVAIVTKDYSKLLPKIKEALPELIKIVLGCITDSKVIEEEAKLEATYPACLVKCTAMYPTNPSAKILIWFKQILECKKLLFFHFYFIKNIF